jgi:hypothetical protein
LDGQQVASEFQAQDQALSIEVLELVQDIDLPDWSDYQLTPYTGDNPHLELSGVRVSVEPDLVIRGVHRGQPVVGALKIHLSKTNVLNEAGAKNVATLLRVFAEKHLLEEGESVLPQLCVAIDAFGQQFHTAPKASKRHLGYVEAACEEIALWWGVV